MHVEAVERVKEDLRHDQPRGLLVVCRNHIPRRIVRAGRREAGLIGGLIGVPVAAFGHVGGAKLPVLGRVVDAIQKALALFVLGQMQEFGTTTRLLVWKSHD